MPAVDPLAALAAHMAAAQTEVADAALDLGAIAQILQAQLSLGDVLEATVLPARGGQDLIEIAGQTVLAQLPPDVHPGETLLLQVTGFQGNQILVRNLGIQDPNNPVPTLSVEIPPEIAGSGATSATLTTIVATQNVNTAQPQQAPAAPPTVAAAPEPPIAPPREVFVAASVRPPQPAIPTAPASPAAAPAPPVDVEARIVASRTAPADRAAQTVAQKSATQTFVPRQTSSGSQPIQLNPAQQAAAERAAIQRAAMQRAPSAQRAAQAPAAQSPAAQAPAAQAIPKTQAFHDTVFARPVIIPTSAAAPRAAQTIRPDAPPVQILAALKVPATPLTLAAARLVNAASTQVASALQNLERVLAQSASTDARVNTLQTITSFLARLDPHNEQTFTAQITSFVSNVVAGAEAKIAQLLQAINPRAAGGVLGEHLPAGQLRGAAQAETSAAVSQLPNVPAPAAHVPILAQARAVEREMAIAHDLKSTLLSLIANPPAGSSPTLLQSLNEALTALTAVQFNTLLASQSDPRTIVMNIPVMFYNGGQSAQIRISRDAPKHKQRIDGDNFHIAFVLDTATLGTVGIDLETVGRSVKVSVKTDRSSAVDRFKTTFPELTSRLEQLRYKIASMGAGMIGAMPDSPPVIAEASLVVKRNSQVDLHA